MLVWCNPEELDYIAVTSVDRKKGPFVVPRLEPIPAIDASPEQLHRNADQINAHNDYARTAYRFISPNLVSHTFRKVFPDTNTVAIGERLEAGVEIAKAGKDRTRKNVSKVQKLSRQLNMRPADRVSPATLDSVAAGFDLIAEARELRSVQKRNGSGASDTKTYVLDSPAKPLTPSQRNGMYWRLFNAAKAVQPTLNQFALMTRAIGRVKKIAEMTDKEFRKVCHIFESIVNKEQKV